MHGVGGLVAFVAVVVAPVVWSWWRTPRLGKFLTPITDGCIRPIEFRPGPPPLPEHDDAPPFAGRVPLPVRG